MLDTQTSQYVLSQISATLDEPGIWNLPARQMRSSTPSGRLTLPRHGCSDVTACRRGLVRSLQEEKRRRRCGFKEISLGRWVVVVLVTRSEFLRLCSGTDFLQGSVTSGLTAARDAGPLPSLPHFEKHSLVGQRMRQTGHTTTPEFVANMVPGHDAFSFTSIPI